MADKIIEGLWDCPYCGAKQIGGLTKHCPNCGHPQDKGTRFYLGESLHYLDEDLAKEYGNGPDWCCDYCGSLNRHFYKYCSNCSSPKEEAKDDYFTNQEEHVTEGDTFIAEHTQSEKQVKKPSLLRRLLPVLAIGLFFFLILGSLNSNKNYDGRVSAKEWTRVLTIQEEQTVVESGFSVPSSGRVISQSEEIHHYDQVLDHYETRSRQVSEQVFDHYEDQISYVNNGDGTFTEQHSSYPVYRTEYRTEYYEEPVYRSVPIYATCYRYEIERWIETRSETARGTEDAPYWPDSKLTRGERVSREEDEYIVTITVSGKKGDMTYTLEVSESDFDILNVNDSLELEVSGNRIIGWTKK